MSPVLSVKSIFITSKVVISIVITIIVVVSIILAGPNALAYFA